MIVQYPLATTASADSDWPGADRWQHASRTEFEELSQADRSQQVTESRVERELSHSQAEKRPGERDY